MIIIIGINHTEKLENQLLNIIRDFKPKAICLELDELSFKLLNNELDQKQIKSYFSSMPLTFKLLSLYKAKSQEDSSVDRMWDSKFVIELSKTFEFKIIPIDINKKNLYNELDAEISFSEKFRILIGLIKKLVFSKNETDASNDYEKKFTVLKKYLIDRRSEYMSNEIIKNAMIFGDILVLIGNNHLENFKKLIILEGIKIINLEEFRNL